MLCELNGFNVKLQIIKSIIFLTIIINGSAEDYSNNRRQRVFNCHLGAINDNAKLWQWCQLKPVNDHKSRSFDRRI